MNMSKEIWYETDKSTNVSLLEKVYNLDYCRVLVPFEDRKILYNIIPPRRIKISFIIKSKLQFEEFLESKFNERCDILLVNNFNLINLIKESKFRVGLLLNVNDQKTMEYAADIASDLDILLIEFKDATNIPLELILSKTQREKVRIFKKVITAEDGKVSFQTMEMGSDGIVLNSDKINEIVELNNIFSNATRLQLQMKEAIVTKIKHVDMGDRVCIDTTSELDKNEGMILGSTSEGGIVVCSETHYLPYMDLRPFRVNAGAIHLYVWGPGNKTYYLSDLRAGRKIYVVNSEGKVRIVTIGRLKIERRPLLYIEAKIDETKINTFIQDDWHVRVMGSKGEILPSSEIIIGEKLLAYRDEPGRHVGIKIDEKIKEY